MKFINLTPHPIDVYTEQAFEGLTQVNPTTWTAASVYSEQAVAIFPPAVPGGARISTETVSLPHGLGGIPVVVTSYGDAIGIPDDVGPEDVLIVSLPMLSIMRNSGHPLAHQCVSPYKVVRSAENGSIVLGCMGFTK